MQKQRLSFKTLILIIGLVGSFTLVLAPQRAKADYEVCHDSFVFNDTNYSIVDHGYWATSLILGETDDGLGAGYYANAQADFPSTFVIDHIYFDYYPSSGSRYYNIQLSGGGTYTSGNVFNTGTPLSWQTITLSFSAINATHVFVQFADSGVQQIKNIRFCATYAGTPSPTPTATVAVTPSPTPTIAPSSQPPAQSGSLGKACQLLGLSESSFTSLPGKWQLDPGSGLTPPHNPEGSTQGLYILQGSATLPLTLDPSKRYSIYLAYHILDTTYSPGEFRVSLGSSPAVNVTYAAALTSQTYTIPDSVYQPSDGSLFDFTIAKDLREDGEPGLIIDFACVSTIDVTADGSAAAVPAILVSQCRNCTYRPVGDLIRDIPQLLGWLWCALSQLWDCVAKALFAGMWKSIVAILTLLSFIRIWAGLIVKNAGTWVTGNISAVVVWVTATILNIIISIYNAISQIIQNTGIVAFVNGIGQIISGFGTLFNNLIDAVTALGQGIGTTISVIGYWIGRAFDLAYAVLAFIPGVIASIVAGFNNTNTIPAWAAACNDSNTLLYYPCLGMYVLDNTIFDGPVYLLIPVAMGFMGFNTLLWAVQQVKHSFEEAS